MEDDIHGSKKGKGSQSGGQLPKGRGNSLASEGGKDLKKKNDSQYSKDMAKEAGQSKPNL